MRRLLPLVVLVFVACGDKPGTPPPDEPGPSGSTIQGSLTVHSRIREFTPDANQGLDVYVLLGDGSRFRQPLDQDGVARFVDPSIQGPQDVTVLAVGRKGAFADTYLGLEKPEVWLQQYTQEDAGGEKLATLKGRVAGRTTGALEVIVVSTDGRVHGNSARAASDGTFEVDVFGGAVAPVHLLAIESSNPTRRIGIKKDITFELGQTLDDVEVVLERAEDQQQRVDVRDFEPYGTAAYVTMDYYFGSMFLFRNEVTSAPPLQLPAMSLTPPFDGIQVLTTVIVGTEGESGVTSASAKVLSGGEPIPVVTIPPPLQLTSVPLGTVEAPAVARLEDFSLVWSVAPTAQVVHLSLNDQGGDHKLSWRVTAPSSITSFTPFELPAALTPVTRLPPGLTRVEVSAERGGPDSSYADLFEQYEAPLQRQATWDLSRGGFVRLVE